MTQDQKPQETDEKEPIKVTFSLPQLAGGALAAATAAAIGSQLGVAGTILGAMVASIIGGVAGTLYSAGIDKTHRKVSDAITRGYDQLRSAPDYDPDAVQALDASPVLPGMGDTQPLPAVEEETRVDTQPAPAPDREARRRKLWKRMGLSAAVIFLLALVAVTVVELGLGRALNGGGDTTIGQVVRPESKPTPTRTPTPTPTPTLTPTATPAPTFSEQPTTPAPTVTEPTPSAVPSATVTVTTEPTAATTP